MIRALFITLLFGTAPLSVAAYTAEQMAILDDYDSRILEHGVQCEGYELALREEWFAIGETSNRTPDETLEFGVFSINTYRVSDVPEEELAAMIVRAADERRHLAHEVAPLLQSGVPLGDPRFAPAVEGSAPCGLMYDALGERTRWAMDNDLYPLQ